MNVLETMYYLGRTKHQVPVIQQMKTIEPYDNLPSAQPAQEDRIKLDELIGIIAIHFETQDEHISQLLDIVKKLDELKLSFPELDRYKKGHMNNFYKYAQFTGWKNSAAMKTQITRN